MAIDFFIQRLAGENLRGLGYFERFRKESEDRQRLLSGCDPDVRMSRRFLGDDVV